MEHTVFTTMDRVAPATRIVSRKINEGNGTVEIKTTKQKQMRLMYDADSDSSSEKDAIAGLCKMLESKQIAVDSEMERHRAMFGTRNDVVLLDKMNKFKSRRDEEFKKRFPNGFRNNTDEERRKFYENERKVRMDALLAAADVNAPLGTVKGSADEEFVLIRGIGYSRRVEREFRITYTECPWMNQMDSKERRAIKIVRDNIRDHRILDVNEFHVDQLIREIQRGSLKSYRQGTIVFAYNKGEDEKFVTEYVKSFPSCWRMTVHSVLSNNATRRDFVNRIRVMYPWKPQVGGFISDFMLIRREMVALASISQTTRQTISGLFSREMAYFLLACYDVATMTGPRLVAAYAMLYSTKPARKLIKMIPDLMERMFLAPMDQTFAEVPEVTNPFFFLKESGLTYRLYSLFTLFMSTHFYNDLPDVLRMTMLRLSVAGKAIGSDFKFMTAFYENIMWFSEKISMCVLEGSFKPMFSDPILEACNSMKNMTSDLQSPDRGKLVNEDSKRLGEIKCALVNWSRKMEDSSGMYNKNELFKNCWRELNGAFNSFMQDQGSKCRPAFGLIITGPPGCGKTIFGDDLIDAVAYRAGIDPECNIVMDYRASVDHQIIPSTACVFRYNDAFQTKDEYTQGTLDLLQSVVDSVPIRFNTASLEEKSRSTFSGDLAIITANPGHFVLSTATGGANKLDRRYLCMNMRFAPWVDALCLEKNIATGSYFDCLANGLFSADDRPNGYLPPVALQGVSEDELANWDGPVIYTIGNMMNNDSINLVFKVKQIKLVTRCKRKALEFINNLIIKRPMKRSVDKTIIRCSCGLPTPCCCRDNVDVVSEFHCCYAIHVGKCDCVINDVIMQATPGVKSLRKSNTHRVIPNVENQCSCRRRPPDGYSELLDEGDDEEKDDNDWPVFQEPTYYPTYRDRDWYNRILETVDSVGRKLNLCENIQFVKSRTSDLKFSLGVSARDFIRMFKVKMHDVAGRTTREDGEWWFFRGCVRWGFYPVWELYVKHIVNGPVWAPSLLGVVIGLTFRIFKNAFGLIFKKVEDHLVISGKIEGVENVRNPIRLFSKTIMPFLTGGGQANANNVARITSRGCAQYCLFITPDTVLLNYHFFYPNNSNVAPDIKENEDIVIEYGTSVNLKFSKRKCIRYDNFDLCCYHVGTIPSAPFGVYDNLISMEKYEFPMEIIWKGVKSTTLQCTSRDLLHKYMTYAGECGQPVYNLNGNVLGIHRQGIANAEFAGAVLFYKEDIDSIIKHYESVGIVCMKTPLKVNSTIADTVMQLQMGPDPRSDLNWCLKERIADPLLHDIRVIGSSPKRFQLSDSTVRETVMFPIFEKFLSERYGGAVDGHARKECGYNNQNTRRFEIQHNGVRDEYVDRALALIRKRITRPSGLGATTLTRYQALTGDIRNVFVGGTDISKSIGALLREQGLSKTQVFKKVPDGWKLDVKLIDRWDEIDEAISERRYLVHWIKSTLKDEPLKLSKLATGKGRLFDVMEKPINLELKRRFRMLIAMTMECWKRSGNVAGLNFGGSDVDQFVNHISKNGERKFGCVGDYVLYDSTHGILLDAACEIIYDLAIEFGFDKNESFEMAVLTRITFYAMCELAGNFTLKNVKLSSGTEFTLWINIIFNLIILYSSDCVAAERLKISDDEMSNCVDTGMVGDDFVRMYDDKIVELGYDPAVIQEVGKRYGYSITRSDKLPGSIPLVELKDLDLVKRTFRFEDGRWKAPLALESIYKSLCYCNGVSKSEESSRNRNTLGCAYREMYLHGKETYNAFADLCNANNLERPNFDYDYLDKKFKNNQFILWEGEMRVADEQLCVESLSSIHYVEPINWFRKWSVCLTLALFILSMFDQRTSCQRRSEPHHARNLVIPDKSPHFGLELTSVNLNSSTEINAVMPVSQVPDNEPVTKLFVEKEDVVEKPHIEEGFGVDDNESDLATFWGRPRKIYAGTITAGTAVSTSQVLLTWLNQGNNYTVTNYVGFRGTAKLQIIYTGSSAVMGLFRIAAVPTRLSDDYVAANPTQDNLAISGNLPIFRTSTSIIADLDLSVSCTCDMILPYVGNTDFYNLALNQNDWTLYHIPIHPVTSVFGITPPSITITVYASYTDVKVQQLVPQMGRDKEPGALSGGLNYAARLLNKSSIPYKSVWAAVAHLGSTVAETFGFGRQPDVIATTMLSRRIGDMSIMSGGSDNSYQLMANPGVCKSLDFKGLPRRNVNETKIDYLKKIPSMIVTAASTGGTYYNIGPHVVPAVGTTYPFSPLNMCCFMFDFFKGDMWVEIRFTASPLIRARYLITIVGAEVLSLPSSNFDNGSNIARIVEVCGSTSVKIKVPYLRVETLTYTELATPTPAVYPNTRLCINLIGAIAGPTAAPPAPFVDIWTWADDNMSFVCPSLRNVQDLWQIQTGKDAQVIVGESIEDVKELCKRSSYMVSGYNISNMHPVGMPSDGLVPYYDGVNLPVVLGDLTLDYFQWTFPTFIRTLFLGSVGGMNHRVDVIYNIGGATTYQNCNVYQPFEIPGDSIVNDKNVAKYIWSYAAASGLQVISRDGIIEASVQDKSQYLFHSPQRASYAMVGTAPCSCVFVGRPPNNDTYSTYFSWYLAARDDFDVGFIPCNPAFQYR